MNNGFAAFIVTAAFATFASVSPLAAAQDTPRWQDASGAFSLDIGANWRVARSDAGLIAFERAGVPAEQLNCTLVTREMPTTRTQQQLNESTANYRLNEQAVRDFGSNDVDGVTVISFTRERAGEGRIRHVRLFAAAAGARAYFGELSCGGATPVSEGHATALQALLTSLRFASTNTIESRP